MSEQIKKVLSNVAQSLSSTEQAQARSNIGAQGALTAGPNIDLYNDVISTEKSVVEAGTNVSVNSVLDPQTRTITYTVSATDTTYSAGAGLNLNGTEFSVDTNTIQSKLSAGANITISGTTISATDTTYNVFTTTTDGLVPKASGTGDTGKFLKGNGTWATPTDTTYGVFNTTTDGLVPKSSGTGDTGKYLKGDGTWDTPAGASIVKKLDYGDASASTVSTLLIDADDPEGYTLLKADNVTNGYLVVGPYKTLLDSGVNGVGDTATPVYVDSNGQFATCTVQPGGKHSHTAELYYHHYDDGDHYNVRNIKNYCINHVVVANHSSDICYIEVEAPTLGTDEEYDYYVVFDCSNSSGGCNVSVQNCDAEIFKFPFYNPNGPQGQPFVDFQDKTETWVEFTGSPRYQVEVIGNRYTVHRF